MIDTQGLTVSAPDRSAADAVRERLGSDSAYGRLGELAALLAGAGVGVPQRTVLLGPDLESPAVVGLADRSGVHRISFDIPAEVDAAFSAGRAVVDEQVDAGADLLLVAGAGSAPVSRAAVGALSGSEPVHLVGWPHAGEDEQWMADLVAQRDARRRLTEHSAEPEQLLADLGDTGLAMTTGVLVQSAVRRTLAVIDGVQASSAALLAHRLAPASLGWWIAADRSLDPTPVLAVAQLGIECVLDLDLRTGDGTAALLAADLLASSALLVRD